MTATTSAPTDVEPISGVSHWVTKQHASGPIRLFAWEKYLPSREGNFAGTILLVHGSSMGSQGFDLDIAGDPDASIMDWFACRGFHVWRFDCVGYGRSDKPADHLATVAEAVPDMLAVSDYIRAQGHPDGLMLSLRTAFATTADRLKAGQGFRHQVGDVVTVHTPRLGALVNRINHADRTEPWTFGIAALIRYLAHTRP